MRECTVTLAPSQTLGDEAAPRLVLVTSGRSRIEVKLDGKAPLGEPTFVQDNVRSPFEFKTDGSIDAFRTSSVGQAIMSGQVFFITARLSDGTYVSSRYDAIDFDAVLTRIQASCPFDAEVLMSSLNDRRLEERALNLSSEDLTMIRWALLRRYENQQEKPSETFFLSQQDREYLKRYALQNGLPVSGYLTGPTAKKLLAEAALLTPPPPPPPPHSDYFTFHLCNQSRVTIALATSSHVSPTSSDFKVEGWWLINRGNCIDLSFAKGWFYFYGEKKDLGGSLYWGANDIKLCVTYPGPFERVNKAGYKCSSSRLKGFHAIFIASDQDTYNYTMNP